MIDHTWSGKGWSENFHYSGDLVSDQTFLHVLSEQEPFYEPVTKDFPTPQKSIVHENSNSSSKQPESCRLTGSPYAHQKHTLYDCQPPVISPENVAAVEFHKASGHSVKKHKCTYPSCPQTFTCPHNREQHIREKHTFERPHVCHVCAAAGSEKAFARPFTLYRHLREVHKLDVATSKGHRRRGTTGVGELANTTPANTRRKRKRPGSRITPVDHFNLPGVEVTHCQKKRKELQPGDPESPDIEIKFCSICKVFVATTLDEIIVHQHAIHGVPHSEYCLCQWCVHICRLSSVDSSSDQAGWPARAEDAKFEVSLRAQLETYLKLSAGHKKHALQGFWPEYLFGIPSAIAFVDALQIICVDLRRCAQSRNWRLDEKQKEVFYSYNEPRTYCWLLSNFAYVQSSCGGHTSLHGSYHREVASAMIPRKEKKKLRCQMKSR
nr:hypothetical protein CFP56_03086 [Quercus suber]